MERVSHGDVKHEPDIRAVDAGPHGAIDERGADITVGEPIPEPGADQRRATEALARWKPPRPNVQRDVERRQDSIAARKRRLDVFVVSERVALVRREHRAAAELEPNAELRVALCGGRRCGVTQRHGDGEAQDQAPGHECTNSVGESRPNRPGRRAHGLPVIASLHILLTRIAAPPVRIAAADIAHDVVGESVRGRYF